MGSTAHMEDSGYGIFYSDEETSIERIEEDLAVELIDGDSSSADDEIHSGLFGCNRRSLNREEKYHLQHSEHWSRTLDSSYSSSSDSTSSDSDGDERNASKHTRCLFFHRNHKSEGEINALIASLISFSTSSLSSQGDSPGQSKMRPRSNTLTNNNPMQSISCLPLNRTVSEKQNKRLHRRSHDSPIILLPTLNSPWGSFSSIASFLNAENYSDEEMVMLDGDLPTPESDLSPRIVERESITVHSSSSIPLLKCRSFHVVSTASIPWMTGTAINPLLRACYLNQMNRNALEAFILTSNSNQNCTSPSFDECMGSVTLVIPWLIHRQDRHELYGPNFIFETPSDQEMYIRSWLRISAKLPLEADAQTHNGIRIMFYPARYSKELGSIFALGDICNLIPDTEADCCILEEPEHLNWMRPMDNGVPLWTEKFKYVVGIIHTNYKAYAQAHLSGFISSPFIGSLSSLMTRAHCHRIIKLSPCLQSFAPEKEIVANTHGIRSEFLAGDYSHVEPFEGNFQSIYFIGKLLWAKGLDKLLHLQYYYKKITGEFFKMDIYGTGPDEVEIKRAFRGSQDETVKTSGVEETFITETAFRHENILRSIDSFMSDLHDWRRTPVPCEFHGRVDHAEIRGRHKIFLNPSITEVLCTTTAEALAMGHFIIVPHHPSNSFFEDFPNCLVYKNNTEFVSQLHFAMTNHPTALSSEYAYRLSWEAATSRLITASVTTRRDSCKIKRLGLSKADEKAVKFLRSALQGYKGDVIRTMIGGRIVGEQYQYSLKGKEIEKILLQSSS